MNSYRWLFIPVDLDKLFPASILFPCVIGEFDFSVVLLGLSEIVDDVNRVLVIFFSEQDYHWSSLVSPSVSFHTQVLMQIFYLVERHIGDPFINAFLLDTQIVISLRYLLMVENHIIIVSSENHDGRGRKLIKPFQILPLFEMLYHFWVSHFRYSQIVSEG